jgi:hypothetical protein
VSSNREVNTVTVTHQQHQHDQRHQQQQYPWDLTRAPNYATAPSVATEDADRLDPATFQHRYVLRNRPCLVKRAVVRWPAFRSWRDPSYVAWKIGDVESRASCQPKIEGFGLRAPSQDDVANQTTIDHLLPPEQVRNLLPRLHAADDDVLFVELRPRDKGVACLADDLMFAGERFAFLPHPPRPRFNYSGWAVMFYKNSYSDWHFHPGTEALMCQVAGTKDVLLLPPTKDVWDRVVPVHVRRWKVYDVDESDNEFAAYREVRPYHVVVEPGDGLFLPVNWWHAVQARPREFGVTVPITWDSPYCDLRQPATRHFLRVLWRRRKALAATELLSAARQTVVHTWRERQVDSQPANHAQK